MSTKLKIVGITAVLVLIVSAFIVGQVFAQEPTPFAPFARGMMGGYAEQGGGYGGMMGGGYGGMMGRYAQQGDGDWMDAMHEWMTNSGGMHTLVWDSLAQALDMSTDDLYAALDSGKSLSALAEEKGLDRAELAAQLEDAVQSGLKQAVTDGVMTQEQADEMSEHMTGHFDWMLDYMGSENAGQFGPGGCHGGFYGTDGANSQNRP